MLSNEVMQREIYGLEVSDIMKLDPGDLEILSADIRLKIEENRMALEQTLENINKNGGLKNGI